MSDSGFGKGERLSNVATHPLTQGVVPPFHRGCLPSFFSHTLMGFRREDLLRGYPKITERMAMLVLIRDGLPSTKACCFAAVTNGKRHDLACPSAQCCPQPSYASFFQHTTPHLIEFKNVIWRCRQECIFSLRQLLDMGAEPPRNGLPRNGKATCNSTQATTLKARPQHGLLLGCRIGWLWREHPLGATILAMGLSCSTTVRSISDTMCTFPDATFERHCFLYHTLIISHHLLPNRHLAERKVST